MIAFALLCVFVFTIPWEKSITLPGVGTLARLAGVLAFAAGLVDAVRRRDWRAPNLLLATAAAFVFWCALTWFWSVDRDATAARVSTYCQLLAMLWLLWQVCRTRAQVRTLLVAWLAGAAVASAATLVRYSQGLQTYWKRYAAPGFDPNDLGITVAIAIPIALYLALTSRPAAAWVCRALVLLCGAAILLTASRTALIAAAAGFGFVLFTWRRSDLVQRMAGVSLALLLVAGAVSLAPKESRARIATTTTEITRGTLHNRTQIWKAGLRVFRQHPLAGFGAGAYPEAVKPLLGVPPVAGHEYVAHNSFLSVLVETGAAGLALYALFLLVVVVFVWALPPNERGLWSAVLLVWLLGASTLTWEHRKPSWLIPALISVHWARAFREET
jgi:O-antigen ligase